MLHALGFLHEHVRPDRDNYVKVNAANIRHGKEHQFAIMNTFDWFDMNSERVLQSRGNHVTCLSRDEVIETYFKAI